MLKPLTAAKPKPKEDALLSPEDQEKKQKIADSLSVKDKETIIATTEERIHIIFDDSGSMDFSGTSGPDTRIALAKEGMVDYLKNCKPHVSAVEVQPLNDVLEPMTKNLPALASKIKQIEATGGTPLFEYLHKMAESHKDSKYTRALIFTDGEAGDTRYFPNIKEELMMMKIPIDFIIIGNGRMNEASLSGDQVTMKSVAESSGGQFLICNDAADFKKKLKYFAPLLRHMLPQIASEESYGKS